MILSVLVLALLFCCYNLDVIRNFAILWEQLLLPFALAICFALGFGVSYTSVSVQVSSVFCLFHSRLPQYVATTTMPIAPEIQDGATTWSKSGSKSIHDFVVACGMRLHFNSGFVKCVSTWQSTVSLLYFPWGSAQICMVSACFSMFRLSGRIGAESGKLCRRDDSTDVLVASRLPVPEFAQGRIG